MKQALLHVDELSVRYRVAGATVEAVRAVSLAIQPGKVLGLAGESGSGKSSLARAVVGLEPIAAGSIQFDGEPLPAMPAARTRESRRRIQIVFQDPYSSVNPRMTAGEIVAEPLQIHSPQMSRQARMIKVNEILCAVGLDAQAAQRYPHEFSGGQCQRIAIARALVLQPELLVCDEPVSALDVSVQAQIINLLLELKHSMNLAMLFISHDLCILRHVSDEVAVMYQGEIVDFAETDKLFASPSHAYSKKLLAAIPQLPSYN